MEMDVIEKLSLEERKKEVIEKIEKSDDLALLEKISAYILLQNIKIDRNPENAVPIEKAREILHKHIESLPWDKRK